MFALLLLFTPHTCLSVRAPATSGEAEESEAAPITQPVAYLGVVGPPRNKAHRLRSYCGGWHQAEVAQAEVEPQLTTYLPAPGLGLRAPEIGLTRMPGQRQA